MNSRQFSLVNFVNHQNRSLTLLISLLILVSLDVLFSPPLYTNIWRQAQTAMITDNFVKEGFSLNGLYVGLKGNEKLMMAYEFPVYNFIAGLFFKLFSHKLFWGELVSLCSAIITLVIFYRLVRSISNNSIAFFASLFFIFFPIDVLMFTAFQPDALGVMFLILSIFILNKWRDTFKIELIFAFSLSLLLCGLCKYPILVPYIPILLLMYFFPTGKFRLPGLIELVIIHALFIIPFLSWYLYRDQLTDPSLLSFEYSMFFFGDLSRFLTFYFYLRPILIMSVWVWCGTGIIYFLSGLRRISPMECALLAGIPLYYLVVPTVADQPYYLYPLAPVIALFMAKGAGNLAMYFQSHRMAFMNYVLSISFLLISLFGINHLMRKDKVMMPLSQAVQKSTGPKDLIFVVSMYDRGVWVGGHNSAVVYFTKRNGWNIQNFDPDNFANTINEINAKKNEGAKWLIVTWYTPDLEPGYASFLPKQFNIKPEFDSKAIADELKRHYPVRSSGNNFAILELTKEF